MKKDSLLKIKNTIFLIGGLLLILSAFTSCENFLNGEDVRKEIEDAIAFNNANSFKVVFKADSEKGEFLIDGERIFKVGYEEDVQFSLNSGSYLFKDLEAVSKEDQTTPLKDYIQFTKISANDKKGIYKYKVKLLKESNDILIRPVCIAIPKVVDISPKLESSGCDQDTPIKITFNKPMDVESFGDFSCISVYSDSDSLANNFREPYFSNDRTILYIQPSENRILEPDGDKKTMSVFVHYDFTNLLDEDGFEINQTGTYEYRINREYGGQKKVKIYTQNQTGLDFSLKAGESKECTVGYAIDISYTLDDSTYALAGFEAVQYTDTQISFANTVQITSNPDSALPGTYKAHVWVKDGEQDILIKAKTQELPRVVSYLPEYTNQGITTEKNIYISFNTEMESTIVDEINIEFFGTDISQYFEKPVLSTTDKTLVTIKPKFIQLKDFIVNDRKAAYIDINISISKNTKAKIGEEYYSLKQDNNTNFTIRYKADYERNAPVKNDLFITREQITLSSAGTIPANKKFCLDDINFNSGTEDIAKIKQNRNTGTIYIYGKYFDAESGINTVVVSEKQTHDIWADIIDDAEIYTTPYTKQNAEFFTDDEGNTFFCIEHELKMEDGAGIISVNVKDICGNDSITQNIGTLTCKELIAEVIYLYNYKDHPVEGAENLNIEEYNNNLNNLKFAYYSNVYDHVPYDEDELKVFFEYKDKNGSIITERISSYDEDLGLWLYNLNVDTVAGLKFKLIFKNDLGMTYEEELSFPPAELYFLRLDGNRFYPEIIEGYTNNVKMIKLDEMDEDGNCYIYRHEGSFNVQDDSYFIAPNTTFYSDSITLYSELISWKSLLEKYNQGNDIQPEVKTPVIKINEDNSVDVTIEIAEDSWSKFDSLRCDYEVGSVTERCIFEKGCYKVTLRYNNYSDLYTQRNIYVQGCHNLQWSETTVTVGPLNDVTPPKVFVNRIDYDNFAFAIQDTVSGPEYVVFTFPNNTTLRVDETVDVNPDYDNQWISGDYNNYYKSFYVKFPVSTVLDYSTETKESNNNRECVVTYSAYDKAGNETEGSYVIGFNPSVDSNLVKFLNTSNKYIYISKGNSRYNVNKYKELQYRLERFTGEEDNLWEYEKTTDLYESVSYNAQHYASGYSYYRNVGVSEEAFYKITEWVDWSEFEFSSPFFVYSGSNKNSKTYDCILPNGSSNTSVAISSDAPVFVRTCVTTNSYEECKNWPFEKWNSFRKEIGYQILNFSKDQEHTITIGEGDEAQTYTYTTGDHAPKRYNIPTDKLDRDDKCYVVIAFFADGTYAMSEVMQK